MEEFLTFTGLAALGVQVTAIIKYLSAGQGRSALTAVLPWAGLFVVLLLAAQADATAGLVVPGLADVTLGAADVASLALIAMTVGSSGSVAFVNFRKAIDGGDTAVEPRLGGGTGDHRQAA
jgi:hypothetical protein